MMNKRQKIIRGIECCLPVDEESYNCNDCPYSVECWNGSVSLPLALILDVKEVLQLDEKWEDDLK